MKNLFLYAKYFAIEDESTHITMDHIIKAAQSMHLGESAELINDISEYIEEYEDSKDYNMIEDLF